MKKSILTLVAVLCLLACSLCAPITATAIVPEPSAETRALKPITSAQIIHCYSALDTASYANTYATNYNDEYNSYDGDGGDCANFASQCLYAGGLKTTTDSQTTSGWAPGRTVWASSSNLRNFLQTVSYGVATDIVYPNNTQVSNQVASLLRKGDVIFYRWADKSIEAEYTYHHTAICTGANVSGVPQIAHHSHGAATGSWDVEPYNTAKISIVRITRYGDVDADEDITTTDGRLILQHYVGTYAIPTAYQPLADVDYDGEITSTDARLVQSAALGSL